MSRRARLRLGKNWRSYGGWEIPEDRIVVVTEAEAAGFLRAHGRGRAKGVEFLGWVDEQGAGDESDEQDAPKDL